jgi:signal transduction histidine kinase
VSSDQLQILLVAASCAAAVGLAGLVVAWAIRQRPIFWQLALVVVVAIGSVLAGVVAVARMMFISTHDWGVVALVAAASGAVTLLVAAAVGLAIARWSEALRQDARRLDAQGSFVGARRGPSELQALSAELEQTSRRLEESRLRELRLETSRRELVSWVSHDLRTPLAGMRAMTEALEDGMAEDPARYHRQIRAEVDRMVSMVDDLFELSRIHAGVLTLSPETLTLTDVVSEALAGADPMARARSVRLGGSVEDGLAVTADPVGLSRVISNLVMNAVRHTPADGTVEIRGRSVADGVELSVSDQCGGLSEHDMERVFDLAWRGGPARTPDPPEELAGVAGAGLGLAIVRGIVEAHRGVVRVENRAPVGCQFLVRLPS